MTMQSLTSKDVLEIGPGKHPHDGATVRIDIVPNPNADYIMDVHRMEFGDEKFDEVLMFECLEHTDSPLQALREINRVLKMGGSLTLSVPNVYYYRLFLRWWLKGKTSAYEEHLWNWSIWELTMLLERSGFVVEDCQPYNESWNNKLSFFHRVFPRITSHSIKVLSRKVASAAGPGR